MIPVNQFILGNSDPLIPLAKRAITNNINSFDKFLKPIADKDVDFDGDKVWEYFHMNN